MRAIHSYYDWLVKTNYRESMLIISVRFIIVNCIALISIEVLQ